jgi:hypothetical protein
MSRTLPILSVAVSRQPAPLSRRLPEERRFRKTVATLDTQRTCLEEHGAGSTS